jgi:Xaa-Pro aminopeptidase
MIIGEGLDLKEFQSRRARVLDALERDASGALALVFAGDHPPPHLGRWTPDWNFYYLTGIRDEQGAAVLFDPRAEDPKRKCILFLRPQNPEVDEWDGYRDRLGSSLKKQTGFETIHRTTALSRWFSPLPRRRGKVACLHPFAGIDSPVSPDLALFKKIQERIIGVGVLDLTNLLPSMRTVKSEGELRMMARAAEATHQGHLAAMRSIKPGTSERHVQDVLERGFRSIGGDETIEPAYGSIVGSGVNATVLHYHSNNQPIAKGDLVVIDAGARVGGYTCDVTRTYPASGKFASDQADLYELVLKAMNAAIKAARPGVFMHEVDAAAREIIDKAGFADFFMHGIGHQLGLEVHDVTPDGPLQAGMVITIEPGIYLKDRKLGIRIEDDLVIRSKGHSNLTEMIPKSIKDIEREMKHS